MPISHSFRPLVAFAAFLTLSTAAMADTKAGATNDLPSTFSGSYLAGRSADVSHDFMAAASFYRNAVAADPHNPGLTQRLLILSLATGDLKNAFALAAKMALADPANPAVRLALAVQNMADGKTADALTELDRGGPADLAMLTSSLASAWIEFGDGKVDAAVKRIAGLRGPDWYPVFTDLHTALIYDAAGRTDDAVTAARKAYSDDASALRIVVVYARIMARAGHTDDAIGAITKLGGDDPAHPELRYLLADIKAGKKLPPLITDARGGFAETLYGLGAAIGTDQGAELPAAYLRLASYLNPKSSLITMALGDVFTSVSRCEDAVAIYATVPRGDRARRNADLETGLCLEQLDKASDATKYFQRVLTDNPSDTEAAIDLGNNYRGLKRFAEATAMYSRAIKLTGLTVAVPTNDEIAATVKPAAKPDALPGAATADDNAALSDDATGDDQSSDDTATDDQTAAAPSTDEGPGPAAATDGTPPPTAEAAQVPQQPVSPQWRLFYYRGVAYEQNKRWTEAEADLKRALSLNPEQPSVLNYLGYSWVDRGVNLDLALKLIQKAVRLKPTDGYIVDSLGWAYFKLGRYPDAVQTMEAAVQLSGGDATINDHLGDVYWTVGRKREAVFQWTYARDSSPDKDLLPKLLEKLKHGLPAPPATGGSDHTSIDRNQTMRGAPMRTYAGAVPEAPANGRDLIVVAATRNIPREWVS
jgi:tetratricopeptide (TPR) repeat protein